MLLYLMVFAWLHCFLVVPENCGILILNPEVWLMIDSCNLSCGSFGHPLHSGKSHQALCMRTQREQSKLMVTQSASVAQLGLRHSQHFLHCQKYFTWDNCLRHCTKTGCLHYVVTLWFSSENSSNKGF